MHKMGKLQTIDLLTTGKPWANHLLDSFLLLLPMQCLQCHNCLSILPFPVIRRISQGHWWPWWPCGVLHVAIFFFQLNSLSRLCWLSWVASWLACYRYPPHCPQPLLLKPHPIVDHAAMLRVKRGYLGEGDLNWCSVCIDFDGQANPGSWNLSWINVAQIWGVDSISRIESLQLFRQRGFWNNQLAKLQRCGSRISLGLK